ncbi:hypothetical protein CLF_110629 [Clonorchis sinensis]|uniref:Uncharacterized protein n=1 Tax=Clonorchis sinensis TaxID=79923 RepID=G7YTQ4_CLOSI|nr:hypothetical protein CLF_110629 [Clonorchis sinensis]
MAYVNRSLLVVWCMRLVSMYKDAFVLGLVAVCDWAACKLCGSYANAWSQLIFQRTNKMWQQSWRGHQICDMNALKAPGDSAPPKQLPIPPVVLYSDGNGVIMPDGPISEIQRRYYQDCTSDFTSALDMSIRLRVITGLTLPGELRFRASYGGRCIPNNHPIACLRFKDSGPVTDPVNIADHLNAYFASCYLPIPPNSEPLLTAASLQTLNGQVYYACIWNNLSEQLRSITHRHTFSQSVDKFLTCETAAALLNTQLPPDLLYESVRLVLEYHTSLLPPRMKQGTNVLKNIRRYATNVAAAFQKFPKTDNIRSAVSESGKTGASENEQLMENFEWYLSAIAITIANVGDSHLGREVSRRIPSKDQRRSNSTVAFSAAENISTKMCGKVAKQLLAGELIHLGRHKGRGVWREKNGLHAPGKPDRYRSCKRTQHRGVQVPIQIKLSRMATVSRLLSFGSGQGLLSGEVVLNGLLFRKERSVPDRHLSTCVLARNDSVFGGCTTIGERQLLNDKNKTDPGKLGNSLAPVYQSVNP